MKKTQKLPRPSMITKGLIEAAYVFMNPWARRKIEQFKDNSRYKKAKVTKVLTPQAA